MATMKIVETVSMDCSGECGAAIEIRLRGTRDGGLGACQTAAEALGWTTRDHGKKVEIFCPFCQERARRIVQGK